MRNLLTKLRKDIENEMQKGFWELTEIHLTPTSNEKIIEELKQISNRKDIHTLDRLFGITIVVDGSILNDKMWIIKRKR